MLLGASIALLALTVRAAPQTSPDPSKPIPVSGENGEQGGVFGFGPKGLQLPGQTGSTLNHTTLVLMP